MSEIDPITGLPKELGAWETITKEGQTIRVYLEKKKFRKFSTMIDGIDEKVVNLKDLAKRLKEQFACGGTAKDGKIELQGDHKSKVKQFLVKTGFPSATIEVE